MGRGTPSGLRPGSREWQLAIRICGRLIFDGGRSPAAKARNAARLLGFDGVASRHPSGMSRGSRAGVCVHRVVLALSALDLVRKDGDDLVADDLADVAAWIADELDQHETEE